MADDGVGRLKTVVLVAAEKLRSGIVASLRSQGFNEVTEAGSVADFIEQAKGVDIDLIVTLSRPEGSGGSQWIRDLRLGLLESSPFPVILALLPTADKELVLATLDSGVDDLLVFPLSGETLFNRIKQFTQDRRPFVVTHDYIGPDRRVSPRADQPGATLVKVPNPVRARSVGVADEDIRRGIAEAIRVIDRDKLKHNGLHLLRLLFDLFGDDETPPSRNLTMASFLAGCRRLCDDTARRARSSSERPIRERAAATAMALRSFGDDADPTSDPRFAELVRSLEGVVNEISAYHGTELKL